MRFEWNTATIVTRDVKSLAATTRKRAETRRFKLMVAALEDHDEPFEKRSKACHCVNALKEDFAPSIGTSRGFSGTEEICPCMLVPKFGEKRDIQVPTISTFCACTSSHTCSRQSSRILDIEGDEVGSTKESMLLTPSESNRVCVTSYCVVSICGRCRNMEDAAIAVPSFLSIPSSISGHRHGETFHFFGVYDGHGGPQAAQFCKQRMHGVLADEMSAAGDDLFEKWESCFQSCFTKLDAELCGLCSHGSECPHKGGASNTNTCREPLIPGSVGTTAVVAVVGTDHIVVGNCGDSRAVLSRGSQILPLSEDHKANRPDEVARIEAAGGEVFIGQGHRVCGVLAMSRALGDGHLKSFVSGQPEVTITARSDEDECLILASDGLWDKLSNKFVCGVARKALARWRKKHKVSECQLSFPHGCVDAEDSPSQVVASLLTKLALAKDSKDNISVIVVDLKRL
ncbi:hypothetical protein GOP47_0030116 [Adiantum capillus-veneris]|nr:hypothetical protein GOP47_0030116 [Adiantum capillus-veneris]